MRRYRNAMVDIESLSLLMGAGIMQIGVALFDIGANQPEIETMSFHVRIEPGNDLSDPETMQWWKDTDENLYLNLRHMSEGAPTYRVVIEHLGTYLSERGVEQIWSNRAAFDVGQLHLACQKHGVRPPWAYNRIRDGATAVQMCEDLTGSRPVCSKPEGFRAHDALWDAHYQAQVVQAAYAQLRAHMQPVAMPMAA